MPSSITPTARTSRSCSPRAQRFFVKPIDSEAFRLSVGFFDDPAMNPPGAPAGQQWELDEILFHTSAHTRRAETLPHRGVTLGLPSSPACQTVGPPAITGEGVIHDPL